MASASDGGRQLVAALGADRADVEAAVVRRRRRATRM